MSISISIFFPIMFFLLSGCSSGGDTSASVPSQPIDVVDESQDTDNDGIVDAIDTDDDNDGFLDSDDIAPLDQSVPGDFSTPEAILSQPIVQTALEEAAALGFSIESLTGLNPPNISGYYREEENSTVFVATDNGDTVGGTRSGAEFRYDQLDDNSINGAVVNFDQNVPTSYSLSFNSLLRGADTRFTRYSRSRVTCTVNNSEYTVLFVGISTADIDSQTNDFINRDRISISVSTSGTRTESCDNLFAGGAEVVGGWSVSRSSRIFQAQPSEFQYMCVDNTRAFAPTETWTSEDGKSCTCGTDYAISCQ